MKVYIAGPLFNEAELEYNRKIKNSLAEAAFEVFLPQEDVGLISEYLKKFETFTLAKKEIFKKDYQGVKNCEVFLFVLDGRVPDEGACVELGIAYQLGKRCIGLQTDIRRFSEQGNNLMVDVALEKTFGNIREVIHYIKNF